MTSVTPASLWAAALGQLQVSVNKPNFDTWLKDTVGLRLDGDTCVVGAHSDFTIDWLNLRMRNVILQALARVAGRSLDVAFEVIRPGVEESAAAALAASGGADVDGATGQDAIPAFLRRNPPPPPSLHPALTFDTFVVGEENELACNAARAAAAGGGPHPLVIFGASGLGKTHLANAIAHAAVAEGKHVVYVTAERFGAEFGHAAQHKAFGAFRRRFRECDLLLVDDVQFFESRPGFQEEFFHTFNDLHVAGKQVVVTCDRLPSQIDGLTPALRSRLMWGMQADLRKPSFPTRLAIIRAKAAQHSTRLPDAALEQIAERCCPTVRELEGYLHRVLAHVPLVGGVATAEVVERALAVFTAPAPASGDASGHAGATLPGAELPPAPDAIIAAVCQRTGASRLDLVGRSRQRDVSYARHLAMYMLRHDARLMVAEIQRLFGGRDHSTVIGAIDRIAGELRTRPETRADLAAARAAVEDAAGPAARTAAADAVGLAAVAATQPMTDGEAVATPAGAAAAG